MDPEDEVLAEIESFIEQAEQEERPRTKTVRERKGALFIAAMMTSANLTEAAEKVGLSEATARRLMKDPHFMREYDAAKKLALANVICFVKGKFGDVFERMFDLMSDPEVPASVRSQTGIALLKIIHQMIEHDTDRDLLRQAQIVINEIRLRNTSISTGGGMRLLELAEANEVIDAE